MKKIIDKLTEHFKGNRSTAYIAFGLFVVGFLFFIANSVLLMVSSGRPYVWLRVALKIGTDLPWVAGSMLGTNYYPTKRNRLLMGALVWYMLGDIAVMFSFQVGGVLYCIGHVLLLRAIIETTYIRKWQKLLFFVCFIASLMIFLLVIHDIRSIVIGTVYVMIVSAVMVFSLTNRFFWLAGIVFIVSDITGLLREAYFNNNYAYTVTSAIYTTAFFMLCISVYSTNCKEVVTVNDLFSMLSDSKSMDVSFWVCGKLALGLIKGEKRYSYERIDLAYDIDHTDDFLAWIRHAGYERNHRYSGGIRSYYSEKYGELVILPCRFEKDGSAVLTTENGTQLELDKGFFEEVHVLGRTIPCIAPGGQELIKEVIEE